jgi:hypothetical protein
MLLHTIQRLVDHNDTYVPNSRLPLCSQVFDAPLPSQQRFIKMGGEDKLALLEGFRFGPAPTHPATTSSNKPSKTPAAPRKHLQAKEVAGPAGEVHVEILCKDCRRAGKGSLVQPSLASFFGQPKHKPKSVTGELKCTPMHLQNEETILLEYTPYDTLAEGSDAVPPTSSPHRDDAFLPPRAPLPTPPLPDLSANQADTTAQQVPTYKSHPPTSHTYARIAYTHTYIDTSGTPKLS